MVTTVSVAICYVATDEELSPTLRLAPWKSSRQHLQKPTSTSPTEAQFQQLLGSYALLLSYYATLVVLGSTFRISSWHFHASDALCFLFEIRDASRRVIAMNTRLKSQV
ncbi:hypothetical protein BJ878DRAFT_575012 [Calycina marina]|uniref:Uncharacterized protein n=1 Tax=Calycina marina TaxID=1763456 RepID=A0A9P7Z463_9HELO|nr:hypothetical protein BJ878DRAFT_575012 [Calycina marina]